MRIEGGHAAGCSLLRSSVFFDFYGPLGLKSR